MTQQTLINEPTTKRTATRKPKPKAVYTVDEFKAPTGRVLALDLGTNLGYAYTDAKGFVMHGSKEFSTKHGRGQRWITARMFLAQLITDHKIEEIAYEDVKNHSGVIAAHVYGAFLAILEELADRFNLKLYPHGVSSVKKGWTGMGRVEKEMMVKGALDRGFKTNSHDAADALAILHLHGKTRP